MLTYVLTKYANLTCINIENLTITKINMKINHCIYVGFIRQQLICCVIFDKETHYNVMRFTTFFKLAFSNVNVYCFY